MGILGRHIAILILVFAHAPVAPCRGQDRLPPAELSFWTVGGAEGFVQRFPAEFSQRYASGKTDIDRILLTIAEEPLTQNQIQQRSAVSESQLQEIISSLEAMRLIRRDGHDRWATTVPVITDRRMKGIREDLLPIASAVARHIERHIPQLPALYEEVRSPHDPSWKDVAHLLIDKFIIDGTFHTAIGSLERERGAQRYYDQDQQSLAAFFIERGENFSSFGTNWYPFTAGDAQREVYVLHGALFKRFEIRMNAHRGDPEFSAALFQITPEGGIDSLTERGREILSALDWIADDRLLVPEVQASTIKSLRPTLDAIGRGAAALVFDNHSVIIDSFNSSTYSRFLYASGDYIQACYHTLFGAILEQLAHVGALPAVPESVPEHFGVYIILGRLF